MYQTALAFSSVVFVGLWTPVETDKKRLKEDFFESSLKLVLAAYGRNVMTDIIKMR